MKTLELALAPTTQAEKPLPSTPSVPARDQFALPIVIFLIIMHAGAFLAAWRVTWAAVGVCLLLHAVCGGLGICVGYHRLLTHRSFKCPRAVEYVLAFLGSLSLESNPTSWVAHHRQHHQYADRPGDPHSARQGFWWSHILWIAWAPTEASAQNLYKRYTADLLPLPFYQFMSHVWAWPSVVLAVLLYMLGGWPWVLWGVCVRLVFCYHCTWFVNSASHRFGYKNFPLDDLSTNCWWVSILAYGEGWHNNHHAFPTSARHGLRVWEFDPAYGFIRLLHATGLAWDVKTAPVTFRGAGQASEAPAAFPSKTVNEES